MKIEKARDLLNFYSLCPCKKCLGKATMEQVNKAIRVLMIHELTAQERFRKVKYHITCIKELIIGR